MDTSYQNYWKIKEQLKNAINLSKFKEYDNEAMRCLIFKLQTTKDNLFNERVAIGFLLFQKVANMCYTLGLTTVVDQVNTWHTKNGSMNDPSIWLRAADGDFSLRTKTDTK